MGRTAENLVEEFSLTREQQDEYAVQSHHKAHLAQSEGKFEKEIVPVEVRRKRKKPLILTKDETINPNVTMEGISRAPAVF
jgi:acetyl-CoA acetyltransferase